MAFFLFPRLPVIFVLETVLVVSREHLVGSLWHCFILLVVNINTPYELVQSKGFETAVRLISPGALLEYTSNRGLHSWHQKLSLNDPSMFRMGGLGGVTHVAHRAKPRNPPLIRDMWCSYYKEI